jgi:hypothetical protein
MGRVLNGTFAVKFTENFTEEESETRISCMRNHSVSGVLLSEKKQVSRFMFGNAGSATNLRVPHISLVFREMWDSTELD